MTSGERLAYRRGFRAAEERLKRRADFMATINTDLLTGISGTLSDAEQRAVELHERRIKGL